MKVLILALLLVSCELGHTWNYKMVREKTSNVIRDTNLSVKVTRKTDEQTEFTLNLYVKPIIGGARREVIKRSFANDLLTKDTLYDLREGKIITAPEYRVRHIGEMDG